MKRRGQGSGAKKKRRESTVRRRSPHRPAKVRILIVCEGKETEPNYFRGLRDEEVIRRNFSVVVQKGKGGSCLAVVKQAITEQEKATARGEDFDEVWCVFDVEHPSKRDQVIEAQTRADEHRIRQALSNPAFECWLLAHFVRTKRAFSDAAAIIKELNKHWRPEFDRDYDKNDEQLYPRLANRTRTAIHNARTVRTHDWDASDNIVDCNSASDVYLLAERLLGPPE
jgi:hypothetical protein